MLCWETKSRLLLKSLVVVWDDPERVLYDYGVLFELSALFIDLYTFRFLLFNEQL